MSQESGVRSQEIGLRGQESAHTFYISRLCGYWLQTILSARNEQKYYINTINETI